MTYRGSLKLCLSQMAYQFALGNYDNLVITCSDRGKYYTLLTPAEFESVLDTNKLGNSRILLMCSKRELNAILRTDQTDLFKREAKLDNAQTIPSGKFDSSSDPVEPSGDSRS